MQCLVLQQPWAWAVMAGAKPIENRTWTTDYRGPIAILAGASKTLVNQVAKFKNLQGPAINFSYGAIVGVVDLIDVTPLNESLEENLWAYGPYCWHFGNVRRFAEPIPAKGKLKLFNLDSALSHQVKSAIVGESNAPLTPAEIAWIDAIAHLENERERYESLYQNYHKLDDGKGALRLAEAAKGRWADPNTIVDCAYAKLKLADLEGSLTEANRAIRADPDLARAYLIRSFIFDAFAERDESKAIELNPDLKLDDEESGDE